MKLETTPTGAVRPAAPYLGGKRNLSRRLVTLIAATPLVARRSAGLT